MKFLSFSRIKCPAQLAGGWLIACLWCWCSCTSPVADTSDAMPVQDSMFIAALKTEALKTTADSALALQEQIKTLALRRGYTKELFYAYCASAVIYINRKDEFRQAKKNLDAAALLAGKDPVLTSYLNTRYGLIYKKKDAALGYYKLALADSLHLSKQDKILIYNNLSLLFLKSKNYKLAKQYGLWALNENRKHPSQTQAKDEAFYLNNLYIMELGLGDTAQAAAHLMAAARLVNDSFKATGNLPVYQNMGKYYLQAGKPDSAMVYFMQFAKIIERDYSMDYCYYPMLYYAKVYLAKGNYPRADHFLQAASFYIRADSIDDYPAGQDYFETLYQLKKQQDDARNALTALEKRNKYAALLYKQEKNEQILNYEKQLKQAATDRVLAANEQRLLRQKQFSAGLGIMAILLAVMAGLIYINLKRKKLLETQKWAAKEQQTAIETAHLLLQQQVAERKRIAREMHDELGSTLTKISLATGVLKTQQVEAAPSKPLEIISRASDELGVKVNEIVWSLNENNDNLESLSAYIRNFCSGFLAQAGIGFSYEALNIVPGRMVSGPIRRTLYQTTKELVNNVVRHSQATQIWLTIRVVGNQIEILLRDNGTGLQDRADPRPGSGNGLRNMKYNLEQINGSITWTNADGLNTLLSAPLN